MILAQIIEQQMSDKEMKSLSPFVSDYEDLGFMKVEGVKGSNGRVYLITKTNPNGIDRKVSDIENLNAWVFNSFNGYASQETLIYYYDEKINLFRVFDKNMNQFTLTKYTLKAILQEIKIYDNK